MRTLRHLGIAGAIALCMGGLVAAQGYNTKVYIKQGGEEMVVASGGQITVESGGSLVIGGFPTIQTAHVQLTANQVKACKTTPVEIVPAVANTAIMPERFLLQMGAGTAYDQTSITSVNLHWTGSGTTVFTVSSAAFDTFFTATTQTNLIGEGPSFPSYNPTFHAAAGTNLVFACLGADPTVGTRLLDVYVQYRRYVLNAVLF